MPWFSLDRADIVWFWVGAITFEGPFNEYDYVLYLTGLWEPAVATEPHSWSSLKQLFDRGHHPHPV